MNTKHRRSIRLHGYDYSQAGAYYITICTQDRLCLFGNVINGEMVLNDRGVMVDHWLREIENKFKGIEIAEYVIMPNHVHVIVINHGVGVDLCVDPNNKHVDPNNEHVDPNNERDLTMDARMSIEGAHTGAPLPTAVQWFKTMTTNAYIRGVKELNWTPFNRKLWQRNYYEHIIRDGNDYGRIANYIKDNPMNWDDDDLYGPK